MLCKRGEEPTLEMLFSSRIIVLSRPINALVVLFIPFLFPTLKGFFNVLRKYLTSWNSIIKLVVPFLVVTAVQLLYYKLATDYFLVYSYDEEGFNFSNPEWINFLFSYKKGLFLYTPMYLLGVVSLFFVKRLTLFQKSAWLIAMALIVYVFSSWWMWFYGGSFSARVMVEYIPVFMLPLALLLTQLKGSQRAVITTVVVLLILVCQIQSYQYRYYENHYGDMTKERYWKVFLLRNRF